MKTISRPGNGRLPGLRIRLRGPAFGEKLLFGQLQKLNCLLAADPRKGREKLIERVSRLDEIQKSLNLSRSRVEHNRSPHGHGSDSGIRI
jgi:hypothetical protein